MSVKVMALVWDTFPRGGSDMLVMLALADWCNHDGASLRPSMRAIAEKCRLSEVQARRVMHGLIESGYLEVVGNHTGGAPGTSRQYRLRIDRLTASTVDSPTPLLGDTRTPLSNGSPTPIAHDTPLTNERALTHDRDASHGRSETPLMGESQSVIEPLITVRDRSASKKEGTRRTGKAIKTPIPIGFEVSETVRKWAQAKGHARLEEHFENFVGTAMANGYQYADWDAALMNAIRRNWAKLPVVSENGGQPNRFAGAK